MASIHEALILGARHLQAGNLKVAEEIYRKILQVDADSVDALNMLAMVASQFGRKAEAIACMERVVALRPEVAPFQSNLGLAYQAAGNLEKAVAQQRQAIQLDPELATAHLNLATVLRELDQTDEAVAAYREAIRLQPTWSVAVYALASSLLDLGLQEEGLAAFRRAHELQPDSASTHSNLVYFLHFRHADDRDLLAREHESWYQQHALPLEKTWRPHANDQSPDRRLRIGYVSADFHDHPVGRFLLPLLEHHDHEQFEIFCYSSGVDPDHLTAVLRAQSDAWHDVAGLGDEQLAELIREHRIDILVDLSAHLGANRLLVFARKPAPVQVCYLAYNSTTGMRSIDYRLSDPYMDPPGEPAFSAEETIRLPETYWCYRLHQELPPPGPLPAASAGHVTFGCLNTFWKVTQEMLAVWRELLGSVPGSRLLLHSRAGSHRERLRHFFAEGQVDPARIEFVTVSPLEGYFQTYNRIDICLDPFPYGGGTTTCDALWMGVPVVTRAGKGPLTRAGLTILSNVGVPELVAWTPKEYGQIARSLAEDLPRLAALRELARAHATIAADRCTALCSQCGGSVSVHVAAVL